MPEQQAPYDDLPILGEIRDELSQAFSAHESVASTPAPKRPRRVHGTRRGAWRSIARRPTVLIGSGASLAAASVAAVLLAIPGPQPAYAITSNGNGSITVTIHDLETAVPALNAKLAAMGVNDRVVPVEGNCPTVDPNLGAMMVYPHMSGTETVTLGTNVDPGYTEVVAAEQLASGEVAMVVESIKAPIPSCFPTTAYTLQNTGTSNDGTPIYQFVPVDPSATAPTSTSAG
ncbi:MAG: hypothetical protein ACP5H2_10735 [Solirubrobacteraceae bacterium]